MRTGLLFFVWTLLFFWRSLPSFYVRPRDIQADLRYGGRLLLPPQCLVFPRDWYPWRGAYLFIIVIGALGSGRSSVAVAALLFPRLMVNMQCGISPRPAISANAMYSPAMPCVSVVFGFGLAADVAIR